MRVIVIQQDTDLKAVAAQLGGAQTASASALERLKALNPHVDVGSIRPGTALLVPDAPGLAGAAGAAGAVGGAAGPSADAQPISGNTFETFAAGIDAGFRAVAQRVRGASDTLAADQAASADALGTNVAKRMLDGDPLLKKQVDETNAAAAARQKALQEALAQVEAMQKLASDEIAALGKIVR
ncbi:hypothetical protein BTI_3903 [Burkholderia thailandensis MSMB121]|uniref:hypothetical protein n=1 Tax=Burkholderia humptydooensis TaxID=430531 RepID=UPI0003280DA7|nr:hypothetical protein [Burkholderia humptydooensis]AGK50197.1 hypothetical protein BTI_3903 [Burkholderia thailandensis MSMB121]ATF32493.1 hypothetical protein CO709_03155 [Burkholderia thailandensis]KST70587.1 hypothetical protein WS76_18205 [Burkholderia humptydooensis]